MDYFEALCAVYGRVEKIPDLMYKFEHTDQCRGERLSAYVVRVDRILHPIIIKKELIQKSPIRSGLKEFCNGLDTITQLCFACY